MIEKLKDGDLGLQPKNPLAETPSPKGKSASRSVNQSAKPLPSQERLRELFDYDAETGNLIWKARPLSDFKNQRSFNAWNARFFGKVAGGVDKDNGYYRIRIGDHNHRVHRLVYAYHNGECSAEFQIDHIDCDRANNRIQNLRLATKSENGFNCAKKRNNTSGVKGVSFHKRGKYVAWVSVGGKSKYLGLYTTLEAAANAYREAALRYHGDFIHSSVLESPERQNAQLELLEVAP